VASIPANRESKRAALFHIMFDIIGSTVFGTLIVLFPGILNWFQATWTESARQVAMFHTLYNFATMFLILPFVKQVAALMQKIVPIVQSDMVDATYEKKLMYLDSKIVQNPSMILRNAHLELCRILKIANETSALALEAFFENNIEKAGNVLKNQKIIRYLNRRTTSRLVKTNNMTLSQSDSKKIGKMFRILYDIERIGDHAENIAEHAENVVENELVFPPAAIDELKELSSVTSELADLSLAAFENQDASLLPQIKALEKKADALCEDFTESHINRQKTEDFEPRSGVIFTDMIIDLERSADHSHVIASSMLSEGKRKKAKNKQGQNQDNPV